MKKQSFQRVLLSVLILCSCVVYAQNNTKSSANGIEVPVGYKNWRVIGVAHRTDNNSLRAIVGNSIAINAARARNTKPWPKGSILGKLVWHDSQHPHWDTATVPGDLSHIEFMIKDSVKYKNTGGWGYARWKGMALTPHGEDASFANECFNCHKAVEHNDYVFTKPVELP